MPPEKAISPSLKKSTFSNTSKGKTPERKAVNKLPYERKQNMFMKNRNIETDDETRCKRKLRRKLSSGSTMIQASHFMYSQKLSHNKRTCEVTDKQLTLLDGKRAWKFGSKKDLDKANFHISTLYQEKAKAEMMRKERRDSKVLRRATVAGLDKKPWNYGARKECRSYSTLVPPVDKIKSCIGTVRKYEEPSFDKKPWNYGAWKKRKSLLSLTCPEIYARPKRKDSIYHQRRRESQLMRRVTIAAFDKKPWNYGAGGSKYISPQNLHEKKRSIA